MPLSAKHGDTAFPSRFTNRGAFFGTVPV